MRHSIAYALNYTSRKILDIDRIDFTKIGQFSFKEADEQRYPALRLAREVMRQGGLWGAGFNAAKEVALDRFIAEQIGFLDMAKVVELTLYQLDQMNLISRGSQQLDEIVNIDQVARRISKEINV